VHPDIAEPIIFIDAEQSVARQVARSLALGKRGIDTRWDAGRGQEGGGGTRRGRSLKVSAAGQKRARKAREAILSRGEDP